MSKQETGARMDYGTVEATIDVQQILREIEQAVSGIRVRLGALEDLRFSPRVLFSNGSNGAYVIVDIARMVGPWYDGEDFWIRPAAGEEAFRVKAHEVAMLTGVLESNGAFADLRP